MEPAEGNDRPKGRPQLPGLSDAQISEHNRLWKEATAIARGLMSLGADEREVGEVGLRQAERAIVMLDRCAEIAGDTWNIRWHRGKLRQVLGDHAAAIEQFLSAAAEATDEYAADMWREACLEALSLGRGDVAVRCAGCALECRPDEAGLFANLALAHLLSGDDELATKNAAKACELDAEDEVNREVLRVVADVVSGKCARPSTL